MTTLTLDEIAAAALALREKRGPARRESRRCTDLGNAERLIDRHGDELRYIAGLGWHRWDSRRWERDVDGAVQRYARETARSIYGEAERCEDSAIRKAIGEWARKSESRDKLAAMVALAQHDERVSVRAEQLDADPWLLNVANGAIDLRSGTLRRHGREDLCTKIAEVTYDPSATCPTWEAFLERVAPDAELREFLRRWAGYSLTAIPREHAIAFLCGPGRNGKGVFLLTLRSILGDYACKAPRGLLTTSKAEKHPTEMMMLRGARLAWCSEIDEGSTWDEAKVKDLASEDPITAHYMRQDDVTWTPTHKLWIAGNHKPRVKGTDEGIWSRLRLVPFEVVIPEGERDPHLADRLKAELPGILRWAVEGCLAWQAGGLGAPAAVREATQTYRDDQDVIGRFLAERCWTPTDERDRTRATIKASLLYGAFKSWAEEQGERASTLSSFGEALTRRGFQKERTKGGVFYRGIGVLRESSDDTTRGAA